jgi:hypothetical protein
MSLSWDNLFPFGKRSAYNAAVPLVGALEDLEGELL